MSEEASDCCDGEADGEVNVPVGGLGFAVLDQFSVCLLIMNLVTSDWDGLAIDMLLLYVNTSKCNNLIYGCKGAVNAV